MAMTADYAAPAPRSLRQAGARSAARAARRAAREAAAQPPSSAHLLNRLHDLVAGLRAVLDDAVIAAGERVQVGEMEVLLSVPLGFDPVVWAQPGRYPIYRQRDRLGLPPSFYWETPPAEPGGLPVRSHALNLAGLMAMDAYPRETMRPHLRYRDLRER